MKKQEFKKKEDSIRWLWDISKCANSQIIVMPGGEEKEQNIENLLEKIMKENFPNLVKQVSLGSTESPKQVGPKKDHPRHIII